MAATVVTVHLEWVGHQTGLWCCECSLSTGARVWFTTTVGRRTAVHENRFCTECGGRQVEDAEADVD